jgi:putative RNA 2'-phosphotransferase
MTRSGERTAAEEHEEVRPACRIPYISAMRAEACTGEWRKGAHSRNHIPVLIGSAESIPPDARRGWRQSSAAEANRLAWECAGCDNVGVDDRRLVRLSKRMALALRHSPDRFGLVLDKGGWVPVDDFLAALRINRAELDAVVVGNDKQRFVIRCGPDGKERIRASQGHSVPVDLGLASQSPPRHLYHGTTTAALDAIRATGLHRGRRHHVHLSADVDTARRVGARRTGTVVVLAIDAEAMARDGHDFYRSANGVWLTDAVPARYLRS